MAITFRFSTLNLLYVSLWLIVNANNDNNDKSWYECDDIINSLYEFPE